MASTKQKRIQNALRRHIERGVQAVGRKRPASALADSLRNVNRTTTRVLDEAGVPDCFQGVAEDWDMDEDEARFWK